MSRDPIEEQGGVNPLVWINNNAINLVDVDGRCVWPFLLTPPSSPTPNPPIVLDDAFIEQHFEALEQDLKKALVGLCPDEAKKSWLKYGHRSHRVCCERKKCEVEAAIFAKNYIAALKKIYTDECHKYGSVLGGSPGNRRCENADPETMHGDSAMDMNDGDGLLCGGWADVGNTVFDQSLSRSKCWYAAEKTNNPWIFRCRRHAWVEIYAPKGSMRLDPWRSGGWHY